MKSFDQQFADWARTKPADEAYDYVDPDNCGMCQFLRENGYAKRPSVGCNEWTDESIPDGGQHEFSERVWFALRNDNESYSAMKAGWTFGALADRLSSC